MSITKKSINKKLSNQILISRAEASSVLEFFIETIKKESKSKQVKLSGFGVFCIKKTHKRTGRNPKTKESYIITERAKLNFRPSSKVKELLN